MNRDYRQYRRLSCPASFRVATCSGGDGVVPEPVSCRQTTSLLAQVERTNMQPTTRLNMFPGFSQRTPLAPWGEMGAVLKQCLDPEKHSKASADFQHSRVPDDAEVETLEDDLFFL